MVHRRAAIGGWQGEKIGPLFIVSISAGFVCVLASESGESG
jgi:hypothetical protein